MFLISSTKILNYWRKGAGSRKHWNIKHSVRALKQHFSECQLTKQITGALSSENTLNVDICSVKIDISKNGTSKIYFDLAVVCITEL